MATASGEIILALAVGVADFFQNFQRPAAVERHHAGIAQRDRPLLGAGIGLFADRNQPVALDQQPAIAGGIGGAKAEHRQRSAVLQRRPHPLQGVSRNQRRIAEHDQQIVRAARDRFPGRKNRMRGAKPFALHECRCVRPRASNFIRDGLMVGPDHDGQRCVRAIRSGAKHMGQQRLTGHRMQDFRRRGAHARALAGREHDGEAGSARHPNP